MPPSQPERAIDREERQGLVSFSSLLFLLIFPSIRPGAVYRLNSLLVYSFVGSFPVSRGPVGSVSSFRPRALNTSGDPSELIWAG